MCRRNGGMRPATAAFCISVDPPTYLAQRAGGLLSISVPASRPLSCLATGSGESC